MTATCCNAATSPLGQWRSIVMFSRTSAIPPNSGRVFAGRSWHGMCHSEAVDYSIGAAGSPGGGPDARHNRTATRYQKPSHPLRLFRRTIPDERRIRPHDDEHRSVQRSFALSGFVGEPLHCESPPSDVLSAPRIKGSSAQTQWRTSSRFSSTTVAHGDFNGCKISCIQSAATPSECVESSTARSRASRISTVDRCNGE